MVVRPAHQRVARDAVAVHLEAFAQGVWTGRLEERGEGDAAAGLAPRRGARPFQLGHQLHAGLAGDIGRGG